MQQIARWLLTVALLLLLLLLTNGVNQHQWTIHEEETVVVEMQCDQTMSYALVLDSSGGQQGAGDTWVGTEGLTTEYGTIVIFTFYSCQPREGFCGTTYSGTQVEVGTAACGWDFPIGTEVTILRTGETYTCLDRGSGVKHRHLDVWFYYEGGASWLWQRIVGSRGAVRVQLP